MVVALERIPLSTIIIYFVVYIVLYIFIAVMRENARKEMETQPTEDIMKRHKLLDRIFKIFPFAYLVLIIVGLA